MQKGTLLAYQLDKSIVTGKMQTREVFKGRRIIYAIVATGGKQYRVSEGAVLSVEQIPGDEGSPVELDQVLLVDDGEKVLVGQPVLDGAKVKATVISQGKSRKVIVFKYKSKVRYRRKRGHRQPYTRLAIDQIVFN